MTRDQRGFTVVELLVVLLIISILAQMGLPLVRQARRSARAAEAISAATTVRAAAYSYQASASAWPATTAIGRVPGGMATLLPAGFRFVTSEYRLQWVVTRTRRNGGVWWVPMVRIYITDPLLCARTAGTLGGARNTAVVASCRGRSGYVSWSFDR